MKIELLTVDKKGLVIYKNDLLLENKNSNIIGHILIINNISYKLNEDGTLEPIEDKKFKEIFPD